MPQSRVRFIGSRDLDRDLRKIMDSLEDPSARFVLTVRSSPKAVLIGLEAFLNLVRASGQAEEGLTHSDRLLALQLGALTGDDEASVTEALDKPIETSESNRPVSDLPPSDKSSLVRFIDSRELRRDRSTILRALEDPSARFVVTAHRKNAVLIGAAAFLKLVRANGQTEEGSNDRLLALQLGALVQGLESSGARGEELIIHAYVSEYAPEDEVVASLVNLFRSLNACHIAFGGSGLIIDDWQILTRALEPAEVR